MSNLVRVYLQLEEILEYARVEWNKEREEVGYKRKESYWQGKKDGVRVAMNLLYQLMSEEEHMDRIRGIDEN